MSLQSLEMSSNSPIFKGTVSKFLNMEHKEFHSLAPDELARLLTRQAPLCTLLLTHSEVPSNPQAHGAFSTFFANVVYLDIPHFPHLLDVE